MSTVSYVSFGPCAAFLAGAAASKAPKVPKENHTFVSRAPTLGALGTLGEVAGSHFEYPTRLEERAAIIEVDGYIPRDWAEALAQLDPNLPPAGVSAERWLLFINDCGQFLDAGWFERAQQIGWGPEELFGYDRENPPRCALGGLLWELSGAKLIALSEDLAIAISTDGSKLKFRRTAHGGRLILLWETVPD